MLESGTQKERSKIMSAGPSKRKQSEELQEIQPETAEAK